MTEPPRLHVHAPQPSRVMLRRRRCPICERARFFVGFFTEWYGWHVVCLRCGDQWEDGEMLSRPFKPRWRQESVEWARKTYRRHRDRLKEGEKNCLTL